MYRKKISESNIRKMKIIEGEKCGENIIINNNEIYGEKHLNQKKKAKKRNGNVSNVKRKHQHNREVTNNGVKEKMIMAKIIEA